LFAWWLKVFSIVGSSKYAHLKKNGFNLKPMHYVWFCRVKWRPMRSSRSSSSLKSQLLPAKKRVSTLEWKICLFQKRHRTSMHIRQDHMVWFFLMWI
jgi:hypothetical protein